MMFSSHIYGGIISGNPTSWDAEWGTILGRFPIIYGEWAVLPHSYQAAQCSGLTSANADAVTNAFLSYLDARHANWIAWDFRETNLIQDLTTFAPTTFQSGAPWTCGDAVAAQAGMGSDVKQFLVAHPH
jgi:hypothetical protein